MALTRRGGRGTGTGTGAGAVVPVAVAMTVSFVGGTSTRSCVPGSSAVGCTGTGAFATLTVTVKVTVVAASLPVTVPVSVSITVAVPAVTHGRRRKMWDFKRFSATAGFTATYFANTHVWSLFCDNIL